MPLHRKVQVWLYRNEPSFQVLLLKRTKSDKGDWHPVTGNVEPHEPIHAAALREAKEELGISFSCEPLGLTFTYETKEGRRPGRYHETVFSARPTSASDKIELSEEHSEFAWLAPDEAAARLHWPEQKKALELLVKRYGPAASRAA